MAFKQSTRSCKEGGLKTKFGKLLLKLLWVISDQIVQICTLRSLAVDWINFVTYGTMHTVHFWTL